MLLLKYVTNVTLGGNMKTWFDILLNKYSDKIKIKEYKSNDIIFNEDDNCQEVCIVLKGQIIISTITYLEKEEIINIINEKEVFGDLLIFSSNHKYLGNVISGKKSSVAIIKKNDLIDCLMIDKELLSLFLNSISNKALDIKLQAKLFSHKNIEDRIMYYLSIRQINNIVKISSVTSMAKTLSLPRPSVSRSLSILEDKGLIKREKNVIYIK